MHDFVVGVSPLIIGDLAFVIEVGKHRLGGEAYLVLVLLQMSRVWQQQTVAVADCPIPC